MCTIKTNKYMEENPLNIRGFGPIGHNDIWYAEYIFDRSRAKQRVYVKQRRQYHININKLTCGSICLCFSVRLRKSKASSPSCLSSSERGSTTISSYTYQIQTTVQHYNMFWSRCDERVDTFCKE